MPTNSFEVEEYEVRVSPREYITRRMTVRSPVMSHGIQNRALLAFFENPPTSEGVATNVGGLNYDGQTVYAYFDDDSFEEMYHLLQSEAPVYFHYGYQNGSTTTRDLYSADLRTTAEEVGEGFTDPNVEHLVTMNVLSVEDAKRIGIDDVSLKRAEARRGAESMEIEDEQVPVEIDG